MDQKCNKNNCLPLWIDVFDDAQRVRRQPPAQCEQDLVCVVTVATVLAHTTDIPHPTLHLDLPGVLYHTLQRVSPQTRHPTLYRPCPPLPGTTILIPILQGILWYASQLSWGIVLYMLAYTTPTLIRQGWRARPSIAPETCMLASVTLACACQTSVCGSNAATKTANLNVTPYSPRVDLR